jgi:hypothetical protein
MEGGRWKVEGGRWKAFNCTVWDGTLRLNWSEMKRCTAALRTPGPDVTTLE